MKRILVTGFGPFGGEPVNPALERSGSWKGGWRRATCW